MSSLAASAALGRIGTIRHGFSGSAAGNMSMLVGDDTQAAPANRRAAQAALGLPGGLAILRQVHSPRVVSLTAPPAPDLEADAMVTATPGLTLGILTADCTPILLADREAGVIAAAHAGWKGAVDGVIAQTIAAMLALGAAPCRIVAAIGPTISGPNYEVGPQFTADLLALHPGAGAFITTPPGGIEHFDLPGFVEQQLREAGVETIDDLALCTYALEDTYFSHRRATHRGVSTGRQMALIGMV